MWTIAPVLRHPLSCLPAQQSLQTTVPLFNAWTIWWNADRLTHGLKGYWDAPIFFPTRGAFAFSEPQPATMLVAPLIWLSGSPALGYNTYLLLSLFLNGVFAYRLLRRTGSPRSFALIGGGMMIWLPLSVRQIDVLQLIPIWPIVWVWDAARRHGQTPLKRNAIELALAYTVSVFSSFHHALFLTIVLSGTAWLLWYRIRTSNFWATACLAIMIAGTLCGIVIVPMRQHLQTHAFERSTELVEQSSARAIDFLNTPRDALLLSGSRVRLGLSPGWLKVLLAGLGAVLGYQRRKRRRWAMFLMLTMILSALLAMGPNLKLGELQPWGILAEWMPGLRQVRNVFRFAYLTQMAMILLGILGLSELRFYLRVWFGRPQSIAWILGSLAAVALIEVPAPKVIAAGVPDLNVHQDWTEFVRANCSAGSGILCLPLSPSSKAQDFDFTARWMYLGTLHGKSMVNGYSGFFPAEFLKLQDRINDEGLSDEVLSQLAKTKIHLLVIHDSYSEITDASAKSANDHRLKLVFESSNRIRVFQLQLPDGE